MDKKYTKKIDYKALRVQQDASLNLSAFKGLNRIYRYINRFTLSIIAGLAAAGMYSVINRAIHQYRYEYRDQFLSLIENTEELDGIMKTKQSQSVVDLIDMKNFYLKEAQTGILKYRYKLLSKAEGLVLETCCGALQNSLCYNLGPESKIKSVYGIDWSKELLEIAVVQNKRENIRLIHMDARDLDFEDNSFDTVVDTFGLQSCRNPDKQYKEMKRVCKSGGKILLLEVGQSLWLTSILKNIYYSKSFFENKAQIAIRDWTKMINNDPEVEIVEFKRRNNGFLYYYELKKK